MFKFSFWCLETIEALANSKSRPSCDKLENSIPRIDQRFSAEKIRWNSRIIEALLNDATESKTR